MIPRIRYDKRYGKLTPEAEAKILQSQKDAEGLEKRVIRCPICGFRYQAIYDNAKPIIDFRCSKCKLETPLNLAYFRRMRKAGRRFEAARRGLVKYIR